MATVVKIGGDTTELNRELGKAQTAVGKATSGIGRGMATAFGSSLGPFGELIEKADAFRASMAGASLGTKVMGGAVAAGMAVAAYAVIKAYDAYEKMSEAMDEATESAKKLIGVQQQIGKGVTDQGVSAAGQGKAREMLLLEIKASEQRLKERASLSVWNPFTDKTTYFGGLSPAEAKAEQDAIARNRAALADIDSGNAARRGESRIFGQELSPESKRAMEAESLRLRAAGMGPEDIKELKRQREQLVGIRQGQPETQAGAITANVTTESITAIDALISAIETRIGGDKGGSMHLHDLTAVGGAGMPANYISGAMDAGKHQVEEQKKTNEKLDEIISRGGLTLQ